MHRWLLLLVIAVSGVRQHVDGQVVSPAAPRAHQPVSVDFFAPELFDELDLSPSPFLDRRLTLQLTGPSGQALDVPGFFAGNGGSAETVPPTISGTGSVFRAIFLPDEPGDWDWLVSFRAGPLVALSADPAAGDPIAFDGLSGTVNVNAADPDAPGYFSRGKLRYAGGHYLRFDNGSYLVKGGVDSPENWLGYRGFDNTFNGGAGPSTPDGLHSFPTHAADWQPGDPDWDSPDTPEPNDGRAIIGAVNYLASTGVNSIYFLPMNIGGDGRDTWPYAEPVIDPQGSPLNNNLSFDVSKLAQWDIFFRHAQASGLLLHFVLNEAEAANKNELDDATLGTERRLYYRELVARFGYLPAIQWNICEEYNLNQNLGVANVLDFAEEIKRLDPYSTPVTVHNAGNLDNPIGGPWGAFLGQPDIDLTSLQQARRTNGWGGVVESFREASTTAGKPIPVMIDEPGSPTRDFDSDFDAFRKQVIWPILLSGGGGEWFINDRDQSLEDFREFDQIWRETGSAVRFLDQHTEFWLMSPMDALLSGADSSEAGPLDGAEVLAREGFEYAIYLPDATDPGTLNLSSVVGTATARWFNPRTGAFEGPSFTLLGGGVRDLPGPPSTASEDWALLVQADSPQKPETFLLTVQGGTGTGRYPGGTKVGISATPPAGFAFDQWTGLAVADAAAPATTLIMPAFDATVTATFVEAPLGPIVTDLVLIDPITDLPLYSLLDRPVVFRSDLSMPMSFNVRADISGTVDSVAFFIDGLLERTENISPYALFGDSNGDFNEGDLANDTYTILASPTGGTPRSVEIVVRDEPADGDINLDGRVDFFDVIAYMRLFDARAPAAERTGDDTLDASDVADLLGAVETASYAEALQHCPTHAVRGTISPPDDSINEDQTKTP